MLFNSYKTYPYTADYYSYEVITSADGTVSEKRYSTIPEQIKASVSTSFIGDLVIVTTSKLQNVGKIQNLLDRNGKEIYEDGVWEIKSTQPIVSSIGFVQGYKYKAKLISGDV